MEFKPGNAFRVYPQGKPEQGVEGTYTVAGNALTATANGQTQSSTFTIDGDTMQMTDAAGEVETVRRVGPAAEPVQPRRPGGQPQGNAGANVGLQGAWTDGQYAMAFKPGGVFDVWLLDTPDQTMQGTYTVSGKTVSIDFQGEKDRFTFQIDGNQMTTTDSEGTVEVVRRLDTNAARPVNPGLERGTPDG